MSMMALFACNTCQSEQISGYFKGNDMYQADKVCANCLKRTRHRFVEYKYVDERTDDERMQARLRGV